MAMFRKEYRVVLPITVEEYQIAQLWSVAEASKNETGGGEGIEVINNEPYEKLLVNGEVERGQYTKKIFHLQSRVPRFLRYLAPAGSLELQEEAWNAYPYCKTVITNPGYMKDGFEICIQTMHKSDLGKTENIHNLPAEEWKHTEVVTIDIANDPVSGSDYKKEFDPSLFKSKKSGRGPLGQYWIMQLEAQKQNQHLMDQPPAYMCAYKLVSCRFKWFGFQTRVENIIQNLERRLFTTFHRQVFCWIDNWYGLTIEDIRKLEAETKEKLNEMRSKGEICGTTIEED